jgi:hypothetical protein
VPASTATRNPLLKGELFMAELAAETVAQVLRTLLEEADRYIATLPGPGIAEVRAGIAGARSGPINLRQDSRPHPVVAAHLPACLALVSGTHPELATAIGAASPHLHWRTYDGYDPALIGQGFLRGNAYAMLVGQRDAPITADDFDLGLFLVAPRVLYRDHHHSAPELYAPLTGPHGWRFAPGAPLTLKPAHVPVWNDADQPHATKVGAVPFLCLYGWTRDTQSPAHVIPADDWAELEAMHL